ncbi:MAG: ABC transporter permease, partial [Acidobacteriales bacterium]|nr:ABC transporter permease [Terriglobales bacterium]
MLKSFWRLTHVNPGFNAQNALAFNLFLPETRYPQEQDRVRFFEQALERIKNLPGVIAAGVISNLPVNGGTVNMGIPSQGPPSSPSSPSIVANWRGVTPGYFRAMQTPLRAGRYFDERDTANSRWVVIVSESLARRLWPNEDPLGKQLILVRFPPFPVVGVVSDIKMGNLQDETPYQLYMPYAQLPWWDGVAMVVRTSADPLSLTANVRREVLALDPNLPIFNVNTMEQVLSASVTQQRFYTLLLNLFAGLALLLASVGIYGVMSYAVAQRTHEIGVRVALGAQARDVMKLVVKQGMMVAMLGVALGLIAAFALTRLMENLLFGVSPTDPLTFVAITLLLTTVALLACY